MAARQFVTLFIVISLLAYCQAAATKTTTSSPNSNDKKHNLKSKHEFVEDAEDVALPDLSNLDYDIIYVDEAGNEFYYDGDNEMDVCAACDLDYYDIEYSNGDGDDGDYYDWSWLFGPDEEGNYDLSSSGYEEIDPYGDGDEEDGEDFYEEVGYEGSEANENEGQKETVKRNESTAAPVSNEDTNKSDIETNAKYIGEIE